MGFFQKLFGPKGDTLCVPVAGKVVPVTEVPDPTFGEEMMGKGIAVLPTEGRVVAPCDATVDLMFDTGHAVSLMADFGAEILIHVGLETVQLGGKHFTLHAKTGDHVTRGQLLIEFDLEAIKAEGYNTITPMVVCNSSEYGTFKTETGMDAQAGDLAITLSK